MFTVAFTRHSIANLFALLWHGRWRSCPIPLELAWCYSSRRDMNAFQTCLPTTGNNLSLSKQTPCHACRLGVSGGESYVSMHLFIWSRHINRHSCPASEHVICMSASSTRGCGILRCLHTCHQQEGDRQGVVLNKLDQTANWPEGNASKYGQKISLCLAARNFPVTFAAGWACGSGRKF